MAVDPTLTVSEVAKYLGPPSISVNPDTRVATGPVFHTVISDCWSQPEALATFLREYSSKGGICEHMATSSLTENCSVSFQTFSARPMIPGVHAEYSGSDLASVQASKHQAELELRGAAAEISIVSFSRGSGPQRWMMSLRSIARGWQDLRDWSAWQALVSNINPYIQGSSGQEFYPSYSAKVRSTLLHIGAANRGPTHVAASLEAIQTALMGSGVTLDRAITHESVVKRLQSAVSNQTADAAYSTDSVSKRQREGPYADSLLLGGMDIRGTYFTVPQSLHNLAGAASMMSSKIRCPSYTLVFDERWRYSGNRELNGDEVFASLKSSVQSTRGFYCRPLDALVKSGILNPPGTSTGAGEMTTQFKNFAGVSDGDSILAVCKALYQKGSQNGEIDPEVFFKAIKAKRQVQDPVSTNMGAPYMPDDGELVFGDEGAVMGAQPSKITGGPTSDDANVVTFDYESLAKWYYTGMSLPIVFAYVNWGVCYSGHGLAMSSGKAVFDLHSSGDAMIEKRAANQTLLFHHTMSTASIIAQRDMVVSLPAFQISGYNYGDSDKVRQADPGAASNSVKYSEADTLSEGSLHVHALPLTDRSGSEQTLFMCGEKPNWVTAGSNVVAENDDREEVAWGWGKEWAKQCGYSCDDHKSYNPWIYNCSESSENCANPVAVKGTYFLYDYNLKRHCELSQGIDCFAEVAGPASFEWKIGRRGFWTDCPKSACAFY